MNEFGESEIDYDLSEEGWEALQKLSNEDSPYFGHVGTIGRIGPTSKPKPKPQPNPKPDRIAQIDKALASISRVMNDKTRDLGKVGNARLEKTFNDLLDERYQLTN